MKPLAISALVIASCLCIALPARADNIGNTVSLTTNYPDVSTVYANYGTAVVGPGVEYSDLGGQFSLDVAATTVTTTSDTTATFYNVSFEGIELTDLTDPFTSATILSTNIPGFTSADLFVADGTIFENFANLTVSPDETLVVSTTAPDPAPEPSSLFLLGTGLLGLTGILRRRLA